MHNCSQIGNELFKTNYIDFYQNMYKIGKKSIYIRKYHIINVLNVISLKNNKPIPYQTINRVCQIFDKINNVWPQINQKRKRLISIEYIINKLFNHWNLKFVVPITKSKKTLHDYEKYWNQLCLLIEL